MGYWVYWDNLGIRTTSVKVFPNQIKLAAFMQPLHHTLVLR